MLLVHLSGHSGAGKSRLLTALPSVGIECQRAVLYTSRLAREGEVHGKDYYFFSRSAITALPDRDFYVGPVREMLQAVDLHQLEIDLRTFDVVIVEIFATLWPDLVKRLEARMQCSIPFISAFMMTFDPEHLRSLSDTERAKHIEKEVSRNLTWRGKDRPDKIKIRAQSAVKEILRVMDAQGLPFSTKILCSSPEGPDGEDDWTKPDGPTGQAKVVLDEFAALFREATSA